MLNLPVRALFPRFQPRRRLSLTAFGRYKTPSTLVVLYRKRCRLSTVDFHCREAKSSRDRELMFCGKVVGKGDRIRVLRSPRLY